MRDSLLRFLKSLESAIPPPPLTHHAITYAQHGNNEQGWQDKLALQVNIGGVFRCFFLDEGDIESAARTIAYISNELARTDDFQLGVGPGQYISK